MEYMTIYGILPLDDKLNEAAKDGWLVQEATSLIPMNGKNPEDGVCFIASYLMVRPLPVEDEHPRTERNYLGRPQS